MRSRSGRSSQDNVVLAESGIARVADLKDKKVALGPVGSDFKAPRAADDDQTCMADGSAASRSRAVAHGLCRFKGAGDPFATRGNLKGQVQITLPQKPSRGESVGHRRAQKSELKKRPPRSSPNPLQSPV